jgi:hypothetical protein
MIKSTKNYDMFKKNDFNRELVESNVLKIMRSIQTKNLLEFRPLMVDPDMSIIDGQHRLEAARRLDLPVYFEVKADACKEDIILLNDNSRQWSREDYLHYFCESGNVEYLKLKNFMNDHKINLTTALVIIGKPGDAHNTKLGTGSLFKNGKFKFPSQVEKEESIRILKFSNDIISYISSKCEPGSTYLQGAHFRRALYIFLSIRAVEKEVFMDKLAYKMDIVRPCARLKDYIKMFKTIYNWKNRNPLDMSLDTNDQY